MKPSEIIFEHMVKAHEKNPEENMDKIAIASIIKYLDTQHDNNN